MRQGFLVEQLLHNGGITFCAEETGAGRVGRRVRDVLYAGCEKARDAKFILHTPTQ